ncbi:MAG: TIGR04086 family membrane protein [Clostridia bacterium]|nr:TIGR04086 family membrane protein [Clostridia bacterium]
MEKRTNWENFSLMPIVKGTIFGIVITLASALAFSLLLLVQDFPASVSLILALASLGIGVYFAGYISAKTNGEKGLLYGVLSGLLQFLLFVLLSVFMDSDRFGLLFFIKLAFVLVLSALGGIIGVNRAAKRKIV